VSKIFDTEVAVTREEKRAWTMAAVSVLAYAGYVATVLGRSEPGDLAGTAYRGPLLWSVAGAIVVSILIDIALGVVAPRNHGRADQRDREIHRFGQYVGQAFVVAGAVAALMLALTEQDPFWIANAVYLGFVLSAVLGSGARVIAYRRGFQPW
jgi:drug/metabolite transporter (DMT)-like permease